MKRAVVAALVLFALSCAKQRREAGGVVVEERGDGHALASNVMTVTLTDEKSDATAVTLTPWQGRPPITFEVRLGERLLHVVKREVDVVSGVAVMRHVFDVDDATLLVSIDPTIPALVVTAHARPGPVEALSLRATTVRDGREVLLDRGAGWNDAVAAPSGYAVLDGAAPLVLASATGLDVAAPDAKSISATAKMTATNSAGVEAKVFVATGKDRRDALSLGARLSNVKARATAEALVEIVDAATKLRVPGRVVIEAQPRVPTALPNVWDVRREAERTQPVVDVAGTRTVVSLPEGHYVLLATRGMGWSIARKELDVLAGDATRVSFELAHETDVPEWIGCDFHVHAKLSFDAVTVSYEDRVRSLAAVGVECAAATEHDHIGDHGPAAKTLGLDAVFRALRGTELTTVAPVFGHFNVYPWPDGAKIPQVHATDPDELFDAVHKLPGDFVFQVNHPRLKNADGSSVGYFDYTSLDPMTGVQHTHYYHYRSDYDALEVFNGYELHDLPHVRATIDEWLRMIDRGEVHVATGSSDAHQLTMPWAGFPRTMVKVGAGWRVDRPIATIVSAVKGGRSYVTSGPLLEMRVGQAGLGDETHEHTAHLEVATTSWLGPPVARLRLGAEDLGEVKLTLDPTRGRWVGEATVPAVTKKRAVVAIVEAPVIGDAVAVTGLPRTLAVTNPIWVLP